MIDFTKLDPKFNELLQQLIEKLMKHGYRLEPTKGFKTLETEAKLWRRSRSIHQYEFLRDSLIAEGALYAAKVLEDVGVQKTGFEATDTYLYNYHLLGLACDFNVTKYPNSSHMFNFHHDPDLFDFIAKEATLIGLTSGRYFRKEKPYHLRLGELELHKLYKPAEMDKLLKEINTREHILSK